MLALKNIFTAALGGRRKQLSAANNFLTALADNLDEKVSKAIEKRPDFDLFFEDKALQGVTEEEIRKLQGYEKLHRACHDQFAVNFESFDPKPAIVISLDRVYLDSRDAGLFYKEEVEQRKQKFLTL